MCFIFPIFLDEKNNQNFWGKGNDAENVKEYLKKGQNRICKQNFSSYFVIDLFIGKNIY